MNPKYQRRARRFVYDSTVDGCAAAELIGLSPVSREVARTEHEESTKRQMVLAELIGNEINFYSHVQAQAMIEFAMQSGVDLNMSVLYHILCECAMGSMIGILSTLVLEEKITLKERV